MTAHHAHHDPAVRALIRQAQAEAWEVGYLRGVRDNELDLERADNPHLADRRQPIVADRIEGDR